MILGDTRKALIENPDQTKNKNLLFLSKKAKRLQNTR